MYPEEVVTDLIQIRRQGEQNRSDNLRFRKWIKSHTFVERQFRHAAEEVHDAIDCRQCAECCRVTEVQLAERDIAKLPRVKLRLGRCGYNGEQKGVDLKLALDLMKGSRQVRFTGPLFAAAP